MTIADRRRVKVEDIRPGLIAIKAPEVYALNERGKEWIMIGRNGSCR